MTEKPYEYHGLLAQTWDLFRGDTSGWEDRPFYRTLIHRYGQPALDVGCGTGRLILDYMAEGLDVDGIDNSPEMLALCRAKAQKLGLQPTLYEGWMASMSLPRRYKTIFVPSATFQLITDQDQAQEAMTGFHDHLEPGGALAMSFFIVAHEDYDTAEWKLAAQKTRPEDGALARKYSRARYEAAAQLQHTEDRYEVRLDGELIASEHHRRSPAVRSYNQDQALALYQRSGFVDLAICRGTSDEPATPEDGRFSIVGVRP